jgi:hypothetical protein
LLPVPRDLVSGIVLLSVHTDPVVLPMMTEMMAVTVNGCTATSSDKYISQAYTAFGQTRRQRYSE